VEFAFELKKALQSINEQSFNHFVLKMGMFYVKIRQFKGGIFCFSSSTLIRPFITFQNNCLEPRSMVTLLVMKKEQRKKMLFSKLVLMLKMSYE